MYRNGIELAAADFIFFFRGQRYRVGLYLRIVGEVVDKIDFVFLCCMSRDEKVGSLFEQFRNFMVNGVKRFFITNGSLNDFP
jgi:hypothetical protein